MDVMDSYVEVYHREFGFWINLKVSYKFDLHSLEFQKLTVTHSKIVHALNWERAKHAL
jgi:hypothetical protein